MISSLPISTTAPPLPTDPRVVEAMLPYWTQVFGNASSLHAAGKSRQERQESGAGNNRCRPQLQSRRDDLHQRRHRKRPISLYAGVAEGMRIRGRGKHIITTRPSSITPSWMSPKNWRMMALKSPFARRSIRACDRPAGRGCPSRRYNLSQHRLRQQ